MTLLFFFHLSNHAVYHVGYYAVAAVDIFAFFAIVAAILWLGVRFWQAWTASKLCATWTASRLYRLYRKFANWDPVLSPLYHWRQHKYSKTPEAAAQAAAMQRWIDEHPDPRSNP